MVAVVAQKTLPMKLSKVKSVRAKPVAARARVLITVTVLGSAGPLLFLVDDGETVAKVVRSALRFYAREGRLPVLGTNSDGFVLYCANGGSDALAPGERISFDGCRSFVLCRKPSEQVVMDAKPVSSPSSSSGSHIRKRFAGLKTGLNKLLSFRI